MNLVRKRYIATWDKNRQEGSLMNWIWTTTVSILISQTHKYISITINIEYTISQYYVNYVSSEASQSNGQFRIDNNQFLDSDVSKTGDIIS